jgi:hypothetical protein
VRGGIGEKLAKDLVLVHAGGINIAGRVVRKNITIGSIEFSRRTVGGLNSQKDPRKTSLSSEALKEAECEGTDALAAEARVYLELVQIEAGHAGLVDEAVVAHCGKGAIAFAAEEEEAGVRRVSFVELACALLRSPTVLAVHLLHRGVKQLREHAPFI